MNKRKENIFKDILDFDIKTLFEKSSRSDPCVRGNCCMRVRNISKFRVVIRRRQHEGCVRLRCLNLNKRRITIFYPYPVSRKNVWNVMID